MPKYSELYHKYQEILENDGEYLFISEAFQDAEAAYLQLYRQLPPDQQQILTEFIGRLSELHLRQLELLANPNSAKTDGWE